MAEPLRIGLIGAGSMGALHARVIASSDDARLTWIVDPSEERGRSVAARYGSEWANEAELGSVDAVVIAAPTQFHHGLAGGVIDASVPLLLEKPLADTYEQSADLVERARRSGSVLMCGLLERFNPAVRTAIEIARAPIHASTARHSPYAERIKTGVAGDLLIHDIDIVLRLFGSHPSDVLGARATLDPRSEPQSEDIVDATLRFAGGEIASLSASRVSQRKLRALTITELDRLIEVDLLRQDITVYRHVSTSDFDEDAGYSQQTIIDIPVVRHLGEPLQLQLKHFVSLARGASDPSVELDGILPPHAVVRDVLAGSGHRSSVS